MKRANPRGAFTLILNAMCTQKYRYLCHTFFMFSNLHGRMPERWRMRGARAVRVRSGIRRRAVRARLGRVRGARAPRRPRALRAPRALRQHARLLLLRVQGGLQARPAKGSL